jgi:UDP-N-acetylmuramate dehydrogenase
MNWYKSLRGKVRLAEPLQDHTTFKIGGPARYLVEPKDPDDLRTLVDLTRSRKMPFLVIGRGSNLLVSDKGIDGIVIKLNSPYFRRLFFKNGICSAGAGCLLAEVIRNSGEHSLSGLEFLIGVPGTVGGALAMNAGVAQKSIADYVEEVTVMDYNGNIKTLNKKQVKFGYRRSGLAKYIVLNSRFKFTRKKKQEIRLAIEDYLDERRHKQELSLPSAGCVFKNPPESYAGRLIDLCGLKGKRVGDACVSARHANFIVNLGNARARDVLSLMGLISQEVKNKFNVLLEPEIKIWK